MMQGRIAQQEWLYRHTIAILRDRKQKELDAKAAAHKAQDEAMRTDANDPRRAGGDVQAEQGPQEGTPRS